MFLSGVQFRTRLDSRLKHAGMTTLVKSQFVKLLSISILMVLTLVVPTIAFSALPAAEPGVKNVKNVLDTRISFEVGAAEIGGSQSARGGV